MKQTLSFILSVFFLTNLFGQSKLKIIFDTTNNNSKQFNNRKFYSKTDFSFIDDLKLWNYKLDTTFKGRGRDSLNPFAQLIFWRTKPIDDKISKKIYKQLWTPHFVFEIYNLADTSFCYDKSNHRRLLSSCVPPNVGGDILIIDKFIFINSYVCLSCERHDTKVDYCRPIINYVFSQVDPVKVTTLKSLLDQFVIKEGTLESNEKRKAIYND